ncbi:hypothetical protein M427DRAFT_468763 [Gonapodya prolifera JEL478]|uniref:Uncharacterized protein n=1 Tax=Gonapodya prolifera (strain JEL478) TaxID=1344416 RepID=A0A139AQS7_GONPJ|nr:hypothetical protein M427DRAFT_468763 [Gonapodya prolifera JEL478]|eukprot:KXS19088.1 hypothetical protein M427DRAFT_468763 [Gonapodya prolifera JEL478]
MFALQAEVATCFVGVERAKEPELPVATGNAQAATTISTNNIFAPIKPYLHRNTRRRHVNLDHHHHRAPTFLASCTSCPAPPFPTSYSTRTGFKPRVRRPHGFTRAGRVRLPRSKHGALTASWHSPAASDQTRSKSTSPVLELNQQIEHKSEI